MLVEKLVGVCLVPMDEPDQLKAGDIFRLSDGENTTPLLVNKSPPVRVDEPSDEGWYFLKLVAEVAEDLDVQSRPARLC